MGLSLANFEQRTQAAIRDFWSTRDLSVANQKAMGKTDQGFRGAVTAGKNMDGFLELVKALAEQNGLPGDCVLTKKRLVTIPGFFRPSKQWDVLVIHQGLLVAALELKSQMGPSFGNNFNNRTEESLGSATDFWTTFREGGFRAHGRPFLGYLMLLEDCKESRTPVRADSPHFRVFPEFENTSYSVRYDLLCRKLVQERLYDSAALLLTNHDHAASGVYSEISTTTGMANWVAGLAARFSAIAALENGQS